MKSSRSLVFLVLVAMMITTVSSNLLAQEKPRIGVLRFTSSVENVYWFGSQVADELQDMLANNIAGNSLNAGSATADIDTVDAKITEMHFIEENAAELKRTFSHMDGFTGLAAVTITGYDGKTGNTSVSALYFDIKRGALQFITSDFIVKSGTRNELQTVALGIANKLSRMIFPGK
jgi:hypothetical protein